MDGKAPSPRRARPDQPENGEKNGGNRPHGGPPPAISSGNPRVTVAFPFSKIEIKESSAALADLAVMICRLAGQVAAVAHAAAPAEAEAADRLMSEATALARRLGTAP